MLLSLLIGILFFLSMVFRRDVYKKIGYLGLSYLFLGLIFQVLVLVDARNLFLFSLILNCFFFVFVFVFMLYLEKHPPILEDKKVFERPYFLVFLGHFLFVITLANFIFIGTIAIHEFGHLSVSKFYDCEYERIVYEKGLFNTEILCTNLGDKTFVLFGGIAARKQLE